MLGAALRSATGIPLETCWPRRIPNRQPPASECNGHRGCAAARSLPHRTATLALRLPPLLFLQPLPQLHPQPPGGCFRPRACPRDSRRSQRRRAWQMVRRCVWTRRRAACALPSPKQLIAAGRPIDYRHHSQRSRVSRASICRRVRSRAPSLASAVPEPPRRARRASCAPRRRRSARPWRAYL